MNYTTTVAILDHSSMFRLLLSNHHQAVYRKYNKEIILHVCSGCTGRLTGLWFLPKLAQRLNTNNNNVLDDLLVLQSCKSKILSSTIKEGTCYV